MYLYTKPKEAIKFFKVHNIEKIHVKICQFVGFDVSLNIHIINRAEKLEKKIFQKLMGSKCNQLRYHFLESDHPQL